MMNALVTLYASAQRILGKDFISPEEIAEHRRMYYTEEQLEQFEQSRVVHASVFGDLFRGNEIFPQDALR